MPRPDYRNCRHCGRNAQVVGHLSHTRSCEQCALERLADNVNAMHERRGPTWAHWRRSMAASVGGALIEDVLEALEAEGGT